MLRRDEDQEQKGSDPLGVERIADVLREPVPVRPVWRAELLRNIAGLPTPASSSDTGTGVKRWRLRPIVAIAAGLACALAGAGVSTVILGHGRRVVSPEALTSLTATMPLPGEAAASTVAGRSTVRFLFVAPYASRVSLVGDFNAWNPSTMPMHRSADGRAWLLDVPLTPGRHVYSFVVDGDLAADPAAPRAGDDDFGVPSSVVLVSGARS